METFARRSGIREQRVGIELMLIDEATDKVHVLNRTSAFVWSCLDGTSGSGAIALRLSESFDAGDKDLQAVVSRALAQFLEKGLITRGSNP